MRALIIDDSRYVRGYLRGLLQERGIECVEAGDGQQALDLIHGGSTFNLAFVDWNMPVINGLEVLKRLRAEGYADLKTIMVTTEGEKQHILRALAAGADEYLMKPFDREALNEKLALLSLREV